MKYFFTILPISFGLILLASCGAQPEAKEHTKKEISKIRAKIAAIQKIIPKKGQEKEFEPKGKIENIGRIDKLDNYIGVSSIDEDFMDCIINGNKNYEEFEKEDKNWLSVGYWHRMGDEPFGKLYDENDLELDIQKQHGINHILVFRTESLDFGKLKGDEILKPGKFTGWIWLVDWKNEKIVACAKYTSKTADSIFTMDGKENLMKDNLQTKIKSNATWFLNEWAGTRGVRYLGFTTK